LSQLSVTNHALWLLNGIENGTINATEAYKTAKELDPLLIYFVFRYLREKYPPSNPQAGGIIERLVELTSTYDDLVASSRQGEKDPIREWFDDAYELRNYFSNPEELMAMLVEKIES